MAFPDSPISYTAKVSGQNIDPAHVNDLQTEIVAIETGILNGTARLNSSGSTLTSLSVTGGSTFAVRPMTPPPAMAKVYFTSTLALGSSLTSTIAWNQQDILTNSSIHSTSVNNQRLTPQSTGIYFVSGQLSVQGPSSISLSIQVKDSSDTLLASFTNSNSTRFGYYPASGYKRFDVLGGYVTCVAIVTDTPSTVSVSTGPGETWFALEKR